MEACLWGVGTQYHEGVYKKMGLNLTKTARKHRDHTPAPISFTDHQTYPRLCAFAEMAWTPQEKRSFDDFAARLGKSHLTRLDYSGVKYRIPTPTAVVAGKTVTIEPPYPGAEIRYTTDGTEPKKNSPLYTKPFVCKDIGKLRMVTVSPAGNLSLTISRASRAPVGKWTSDMVADTEKTMDFDLTDSIDKAGNWWAMLRYTNGASRLQVTKAVLLKDGREVARHVHTVELAPLSPDARGKAQYQLSLKKYSKGAKYTLRITAKGLGGNDTAGSVKLRYSLLIEPKVKISSDIHANGWHPLAGAADWNRSTRFLSNGKPKKGQSITWTFDQKVKPCNVEVRTGPPNSTKDILVGGSLHVSYDGNSFEELGKVTYGAAKGQPKKAFKAIRLVVDEDQKTRIVVQDPILSEVTLTSKATVETTMTPYGGHKPAKAADWDDKTYFWCGRAPKAGETFAWNFDKALQAESIEVPTGRTDGSGRDILENGVLEVSYDGTTFVKLADFKNGSAIGKPAKPVKAIRVRVTAEQGKNWLIIRDPKMK